MTKLEEELLKALKLAQTYVHTMNQNIAGAVGHENTVISPDLKIINDAIEKAERRM